MIEVAKVFSPFPAGRFYSDGPFSGQRFREEVLVPVLQKGEPVTVSLAGVRGCGSSFLEEAFGGLIRLGYFTRQDLAKRLTIEAGGPEYEVYKRRLEAHLDSAQFGVTKGQEAAH